MQMQTKSIMVFFKVAHTKFDHPPHSTDLYLNVVVMRSVALFVKS